MVKYPTDVDADVNVIFIDFENFSNVAVMDASSTLPVPAVESFTE